MKFLTDEILKNEKFNTRVFYINKKNEPELELEVPVERLSRRNFPFDDFDIIHTNGFLPDLFAFQNRKKIKYHISTIHNFVFKDLSFRYPQIASRLIANLWLILWKRADNLVCVSSAMKDYYLKWFPESKLVVIHNGIPEQRIDCNSDNDTMQRIDNYHSSGLTVIGVTCSLNRGKGIDILLKHIAVEIDNALIIIGSGPELMKLKNLARKLNLNNRCYFSGFKASAVNYLKYLDLFVMPSRSEGFCLSLVEAVQQKIPVVCSDIPVFRELFNYDEVTFFNLESTKSLSTAIEAAKRNCKPKVDLAYQKFIDQYTCQVMTQKYLQLYQSV